MFSKFYYKRKLKAYLANRSVDRCFLNIREMRHLVVAVECNDFSKLREIEREIKPLLQNVPVVSYVIFMNVKAVEEYSYAVSSHDILLFKEDIVRKFTPKAEVVARIDALKPDVFVNLNMELAPTIDFLSAISTAKMRVGFETKNEFLELMLSVSSEDGYGPFFEKMIQVMGRINTNVV